MTRDTPVVVGDRILVRPVELVAGGAALARVDGFPIFVRSVYPGDDARVEILEVKKGFARGVVVELLAPGPMRKAFPCPIAEVCGGCDWTSLRLDHQLRAKQRILAESLRRVGRFASIPPIRLHASPLNYRLRSRLHVSAEGAVGFYAEGTHSVVPLVEECEVVGPAVVGRLAELREYAEGLPRGLRVGEPDRDPGGRRPPLQDPTVAAGPVASIEVFETGDDLAVALAGTEGLPVTISVRGFTWQLSTSAFFQVNRHLLGTLLDLVTAHAVTVQRKRRALDLYAGVGFFSLPLATLFDEVIAVETRGTSQRYGRLNAGPFANLRSIAADVERFTAPEADFVFADPPRAGLGTGVAERLAEIATEKICYLSCDPVTFSRDASRLARHGWSLRTLDLLDLFPNTHHVETLASFERAR